METMEDGVTYLNSGDWVEHCTALEYDEGEWSLHHHELSNQEHSEDEDTDGANDIEHTLRIINSAA